jgi:protocatechuate 3,4-dioxygenase beta subunit
MGIVAASVVAGTQTTSGPTGSAGYRIAGVAMDAVSGQPLARAEVSIESQDGKKVQEAYATGTDGRFSFEGLTAGRYTLLAGRRGYVKQAYKGHEQYSTAIVVGPGLKTDELRFAMKLGASIAGQVLDERGDAVRNARVILLREATTGRGRRLTGGASKYTNDLGAYRFGHLNAGVYVVAVTARVWYADVSHGSFGSAEALPGDVDTDVVYPVTFYPAAMDADAATRIPVTGGENVTANVSIAPARARHITIEHQVSDWKNMGAITVEQYIADDVAERTDILASVSDKEIELEGVPPGRFEVVRSEWNGKGESAHVASLNLTGKPSDDPAETVIRGTLEVASEVRERVTTVKLVYGRGERTYAAAVRAKGEFEFREELAKGTYRIEVPEMVEGANDAVGIRAEGADVTRAGVEVQPGRDVELKVVAGLAARVRGRVVKNGAAAEGVLVALVPEKFEDANNLMRVDQSDSDGSFRMEDVVPGRYRLIAVEDGWDGDWRSAEFLGRFVGRGKEVEIGAGAVITTEIEAQVSGK